MPTLPITAVPAGIAAAVLVPIVVRRVTSSLDRATGAELASAARPFAFTLLGEMATTKAVSVAVGAVDGGLIVAVLVPSLILNSPTIADPAARTVPVTNAWTEKLICFHSDIAEMAVASVAELFASALAP